MTMIYVKSKNQESLVYFRLPICTYQLLEKSQA